MCFVRGFVVCFSLGFLVYEVVVVIRGAVPFEFCLDPLSFEVSAKKALVLCMLPAFPCAFKLLALREKFTPELKILCIMGVPSESSGGAPFTSIILVSVLEKKLVVGTGMSLLAWAPCLGSLLSGLC